ncbi:MAG: Asp-tRNA(Asn)/Glu-tRNA(Gln) amidotransferase subunit GatA, partial [Planctomycetota bacterium]
DAAVAKGQSAGSLAGVPIAIKDNICTTFADTTCGSRLLEGYRSPFDATAVERLIAAGCVPVGKTNLDEFAMGSSTEHSGFGVTRNPWDTSCVPGGSSGGSAVAVAAGFVPAALGSDTGGSIRQPAAFCGIVGLKPTYGRVSRYGLVAYGSSLDQIGPLTRDVTDAARLLAAMAGPDPRDTTCYRGATPDFEAALCEDALVAARARLRIGVAPAMLGDGLDGEVRAAFDEALDVYRALGASIVEVDLPHSAYGIAAYYLIATAECSSNLARFDGVRYGRRAVSAKDIIELYCETRSAGFGLEVKRRIMLGTFALSAGYYDQYYAKALKVRELVRRDFEAVFEKADVLACPTTPTPAFRLGEKSADPLEMFLADAYTVQANLAGVPAISIPCGRSAAGLPIGLQLVAPLFAEERLLQAARLYERETR